MFSKLLENNSRIHRDNKASRGRFSAIRAGLFSLRGEGRGGAELRGQGPAPAASLPFGLGKTVEPFSLKLVFSFEFWGDLVFNSLGQLLGGGGHDISRAVGPGLPSLLRGGGTPGGAAVGKERWGEKGPLPLCIPFETCNLTPWGSGRALGNVYLRTPPPSVQTP